MHIIKQLLLLLALSQLGACAVISKEQCLNADWQQVGFDIGSNGNTDKTGAFEKRKRTCEKHNTTANWKEFEHGHSNGIVTYCQLGNAVELGVSGSTKAVNKNICSERDYPGFRDAFNTGYKLYVLNTRVNESDLNISQAYNRIDHYKKNILRINKQLSSKAISNLKRKHLIDEQQKSRNDIQYLAHEIRLYRQHLRTDLYDRDEYADYLYHDYMPHIDDAFVDPRSKNNSNTKIFNLAKPSI